MSNRLPRSIERTIGIGLISAAALGGYALGESGNGHSSAANKPKVVATAPATPKSTEIKTTAPKPKPSHSATSVPVLKKADMQPPLSPTGGEYNTAAQAVADVYGGGDVQSGEALLKTIKNPEIKAQTNHALQEAIAARAMADVYGGGDVDSAEGLLKLVTLPDIQPKAEEAVSTAIAYQAAADAYGGGDTASAKALESKITDPKLVTQVEAMIHDMQTNNSDGASNVYDQLGTEASNQYDSIGSPIADEYSQLNRHTDSYLQQYNNAK